MLPVYSVDTLHKGSTWYRYFKQRLIKINFTVKTNSSEHGRPSKANSSPAKRRNSPHFMESDYSLLYSQQATISLFLSQMNLL